MVGSGYDKNGFSRARLRREGDDDLDKNADQNKHARNLEPSVLVLAVVVGEPPAEEGEHQKGNAGGNDKGHVRLAADAVGRVV